MSYHWKFTLFFLTLFTVTLWLAVLFYPDKNLHLIACDVGQGDAILAVYGKTQVLVDGGPDNKVLDCLSRYIPFWDREIELILLTHPQKDHYAGLIDVTQRYRVGAFLATPLDASNPSSRDWGALKDQVGGKGITVINPTRGQTIRLGLIYLDILHPPVEYVLSNPESFDTELMAEVLVEGESKDPLSAANDKGVLGAFTSKRDPNDFSIVALLHFGEFDALLTGDIGPKISDLVAEQIALSDSRRVEYLKVPHHGSKNGLSPQLLEVSKPDVAVISSGKNNRYGHPHKEVIKLLSDQNVETLRTDQIGNVEVISDGGKWWVEN